MPVQNGSCAESGDDSSESSPAALDGDSELRSCTIYNSSIANGRAGEADWGGGDLVWEMASIRC